MIEYKVLHTPLRGTDDEEKFEMDLNLAAVKGWKVISNVVSSYESNGGKIINFMVTILEKEK